MDGCILLCQEVAMVIDASEVYVKRMNRKTVSISVDGDGNAIVKAPMRMSARDIMAFVNEHEEWIRRRRQEMKASRPDKVLTMAEIRRLGDEAVAYIPGRVRLYAQRMGLKYGRITIKNQRSRWGSCSAKKNLNFNCLLMLCPKEVIDAVVVHELCHLVHMNHSKEFYALVRSVYPEYDRWNGWLKENGSAVMRRMVG